MYSPGFENLGITLKKEKRKKKNRNKKERNMDFFLFFFLLFLLQVLYPQPFKHLEWKQFLDSRSGQ
ncbi:hypothetical protein L873DRAFT_54554 [Choiromyces venosus 120613-1]|uniref:Uncharacterized protein n=1 Tax=Choiromyces venosus 120613-1 TaxID=1336337 RepID=A0A3N4J959_9PEZI|nr:hypothetical protein L873DRAFT_54554 [Choiromyces venosus 120613-1]